MNQIYQQFKRTGAYTLFIDESAFGQSNEGLSAIHCVVGQSRFPGAPVNTMVFIQNTEELYATFGRRDRRLERKGCYLIPQAEALLTQGPIFVLNIRPYEDTHTVKSAHFGVALNVTDNALTRIASVENATIKVTDLFDRNGFWKIDRDKAALASENASANGYGIFKIIPFSNKTITVIAIPADMSGTEFENMTVAEYNEQHPTIAIDAIEPTTPIASLFVTLHVFNGDLQTQLTSGSNTELQTTLIADADNAGRFTLKGADNAAMLANLTLLINTLSAGYLNEYTGCILPYVKSNTNDDVSIDKVFNVDATVLGSFLHIDEDTIENAQDAIDAGTAVYEQASVIFDEGEDLADSVDYKLWTNVISGFSTTDNQFVDGTRTRQSTIMNILSSKGIKNGLLDYNTYDFRYILDSFKTYIEPNAKFQLSNIAYESKRFAYLWSAPFAKDFAAEEAYQDSLTGAFNTEWIRLGGNPAVIGATLYSMPSVANGAEVVFPVAFGLVYDDGTIPVTIPGSTALALAYGPKHTNASKKPYDIVNGTVSGAFSAANIVDVEYTLSFDDLDSLEQHGWNLIKKTGARFYISNDATAKTSPKTALSVASNTEVLLYVSIQGRAILEKYVGNERNNDTTRTRVKGELDDVCQRLAAQGVLESYTNTCDTNNNPATIREQGLLIADTELVTADGVKIAVHRIIAKRKTDAAS